MATITLAEFCAQRTCLGIKMVGRTNPVGSGKSEKITDEFSLPHELPLALSCLTGEEHEGAFYWNNEDYGNKLRAWHYNVFAFIVTSDCSNLDLPQIPCDSLENATW